jgi:hypothetical protein
MDIIITPEARAYIRRKSVDPAVTIALAKRPKGSCAGRAASNACYPAVRPGRVEPDKMPGYVEALVGDVSVYYPDVLPGMYDKITIRLDKLFSYEALVAIVE